MKIFKTLLLVNLVAIHTTFGQQNSIDKFDAKYLNWYNTDLDDYGTLGTSVNKTYQQLLAGRQVKKTVIVAVIDGGVDITHEDLKGKIWINEKEIPDNKIDDDNNGYIDDIYGWNFIGNSNGENINYETFEYTRVYKSGTTDINYPFAKQLYEKELEKRKKDQLDITSFEARYMKRLATVKAKTGYTITKKEDLANVTGNDPELLEAYNFLKQIYDKGFSEAALAKQKKRNSDYLERYLNVDFNPRIIVGDNPSDINDSHYGNNNVIGPRASHGTGVAGVIAAIRGNNLGIDGIATDVKIMVLRTTPNGDERDKDVALAIKYAVENGADVINMSFGKAISPQKKFVDDAIRLAESKNVLLVHGAGNSGKNIDEIAHFPSNVYSDKSVASNFINVGASSMKKDKEIPAVFSNYGQNYVTVFAPGVNILSLDTSNTYDLNDGTSLAAPIVTGIAALILSYYPELTPKELINIIIESSTDLKKKKVYIPDLETKKRTKIKFARLSKSGGIINAFEAFKRAGTYTLN